MNKEDEHGKQVKEGDHANLFEVSDDAKLFEAHQPEASGEKVGDSYVPPNGYWPLVIISGRYGYVGCQNTQTLKYRNILRSTALQEAKNCFGLCPKIINYYDEQGHLIATESP